MAEGHAPGLCAERGATHRRGVDDGVPRPRQAAGADYAAEDRPQLIDDGKALLAIDAEDDIDTDKEYQLVALPE